MYAAYGLNGRQVPWTELEIDLPPYPLSIHIDRSPMNGVGWVSNTSQFAILGFDETSTVDIAPPDIVATMIDPAMRSALLAYPVFKLDTVAPEASGATVPVLRLLIPQHAEHAEFDALTPHLVSARDRLRAAYAAVAANAGVSQDGAPFRPETSDAPARDALAAREASVALANRKREAQRQLQLHITGRQFVGAMAILMLVSTILIALLL